MQYTLSQSEKAVELSITGRLTFSDAPQFPKILGELATGAVRDWVIDLTGLEFIDSTGMSLFIHVYDVANTDGRQVVLRNAHGAVNEALDRAGFHTLFAFK
jgi:anti-anti-sigma factor